MNRFRKVECDINFPILKYTNDIWDIGILPVLFGYRVVGNLVTDNIYEINYCLSNNFTKLALSFISTKSIIEGLEDNSKKNVLNILPKWTVRPIYLDNCYSELIDLGKRYINYEDKNIIIENKRILNIILTELPENKGFN